MHNLEMISHTQQDVSRLYANATPFHIKDFSPSTLASLWALDLVPGGLLWYFTLGSGDGPQHKQEQSQKQRSQRQVPHEN